MRAICVTPVRDSQSIKTTPHRVTEPTSRKDTTMNAQNPNSPRPAHDVRTARLAAVALLAAVLPTPTAAELCASCNPWDIPDYAGSLIVPGLFQGGTEDDDVVFYGRSERYADAVPYNLIVTLYATASPAPWGVEEVRYGFYDSALHHDDVVRVVRAARFAYQRWTEGDNVLIRCQAGMNRSGLVTALVLIMAGLTPGQAITLIRERRSPGALFNEHFVEWLIDNGEQAAATARIISPSFRPAA